MIRTISSSRHY